jgi:hypothetical protein
MFIGAYTCASGIIFLVGLALLAYRNSPARNLRKQALYYFSLSLPIVGILLLAFVALSIWYGLIGFGSVQDWSYPKDYLTYGLAGWTLMLLPILGILSPLLVTIFVEYQVSPER